jgi:pSer/pThr/pTyr-binding forkhead associated (FHA) protein
VVVPELSVSRRHAAIMKSDEGLYVRDLSSSNGTFVNRTNITVEDHLLSDADRIQLGVSETSFVFKGPAAPAR